MEVGGGGARQRPSSSTSAPPPYSDSTRSFRSPPQPLITRRRRGTASLHPSAPPRDTSQVKMEQIMQREVASVKEQASRAAKEAAVEIAKYTEVLQQQRQEAVAQGAGTGAQVPTERVLESVRCLTVDDQLSLLQELHNR